ncbi:MAG: hypothetical protein HYY18_23400 [Planctomycetes bacterium]|nr:hypothetical protein [Planctomycetota bacterium]
MNPSVMSALRRAVAHTKWMLFEPFRFWKWVKLAIVAVFVNGIGGNLNMPGQVFEEGYKWVKANPEAVKGLYLPVGLSVGFLFLLATYLTARFEPVFVDNMCGNHARIREPWKRLSGIGLRWFFVRLGVRLLAAGWLVALGVPTYFAVTRAIAAPGGFQFPFEILFWLVPGVLAFLAAAVLLTILVEDVGLPLAMYREQPSVAAGLRESARLVFSNPVYFLLFWLLKMATAMIAASVMGMAGCVIGGVFGLFVGLFVLVGMGLTKGGGLGWTSPVVLAVLIPLGLVVFLAYALAINLLATPFNVFFRSFSLAAVEEFGAVKTLSRAYAATEAP